MAAAKFTPSIDYLRLCFAVQPDGRLVWLNRPRDHFTTDAAWKTFNSRNAGTEAGSDNGNGYLVTRCAYSLLYVHRIVYALTRGEWPTVEVDHIDGNRGNNRPENLRLATRKQQSGNTARASTNTSGFKGVAKAARGWRAYIVRDGKQKHLGVYSTAAEAAEAYASAAAAQFGSYACVSR